MTKTYAILQKKLQELELQLSPYNNNTNNPTLDLPPPLSQEISQKILFLAHLLSAETASCPTTTTKPRHLKHIAHRLAHLEATFHPGPRADRGLLLIDHADGSSSSTCCSCTESCLNDDGDGDGDGEVASTHASSCLEDEEGGEFYECVEEEKEERELVDEGGVGRSLHCGGAMASGFVIGVSLMGVAFFFIHNFGYDLLQLHQQNNGGFVTPT